MGTADVDIVPTWQIPVGDNTDNRNGNRIFVKSVSVHLAITLELAVTMRVLFYKNKNGTLIPSTTSISSFGVLDYAKDW